MKNEVKNSLGNMECNKTPGNDGCMKNLVWTSKPHFYRSIKKFLYEEWSLSQKQAFIKVTEKKQR